MNKFIAYFDFLGFEEKVKKIFSEFCSDNSLLLSASSQDLIFVDKNKTTNFLQNTFLSNLTDIKSAWLKLKVSDEYTPQLIEKLYLKNI